MTDCTIMRLEKTTIMRVLHEEPAFSEVFMSHLLARTMRVEEDLVDQLFNSSEKRLARLLLLLSDFGKEGRPVPLIAQDQPRNTGRDDRHEALAGELFHEQVSAFGVRRLQRRRSGSS
jgi:CRP-like cAMP-binding protein